MMVVRVAHVAEGERGLLRHSGKRCADTFIQQSGPSVLTCNTPIQIYRLS
jgi:hypothetical protein